MSTKNYKEDFPIFINNPEIIYFDSAATAQKPDYVINSICDFYKNDYANIHRGNYDLSNKSEIIYENSKKKVKTFINRDSVKEIIYTYNSNYALNVLAHSLEFSNLLKKGDKVLLTITEHHSNIVPWLILKEKIGIEIDYINVKNDFSLDLDDFTEKYDEKVKIISFTQVSNITGQIYDLQKIGNLKRSDTFFIVDASQSIPHLKVDVKELNCDFLFFTAHKVMAETGLAVLWGKKEILSNMKSIFSGGGAINSVKVDNYRQANLPDRFEPGTPHISGALSLLKAFEYIEQIGGYQKINSYDKELIKYVLKKIKKFKNLRLIGTTNIDSRIGIFSFYVENMNSSDVSEFLAEKNICIRAGQHCAEPFFDKLSINSSFRMSLYIYNTVEEIDYFFEVLSNIID